MATRTDNADVARRALAGLDDQGKNVYFAALHAAGWQWTQIGDLVGLTRTRIQQRAATVDPDLMAAAGDVPGPPPPRPRRKPSAQPSAGPSFPPPDRDEIDAEATRLIDEALSADLTLVEYVAAAAQLAAEAEKRFKKLDGKRCDLALSLEIYEDAPGLYRWWGKRQHYWDMRMARLGLAVGEIELLSKDDLRRRAEQRGAQFLPTAGRRFRQVARDALLEQAKARVALQRRNDGAVAARRADVAVPALAEAMGVTAGRVSHLTAQGPRWPEKQAKST